VSNAAKFVRKGKIKVVVSYIPSKAPCQKKIISEIDQFYEGTSFKEDSDSDSDYECGSSPWNARKKKLFRLT